MGVQSQPLLAEEIAYYASAHCQHKSPAVWLTHQQPLDAVLNVHCCLATKMTPVVIADRKFLLLS
jgi:hypothetical protein